jgi:hypothetical protein
MTWVNFYLVCFLVGFLLSLLSFVLGHVDLHIHVPHVGDLGASGSHLHVGHGGEASAHGGHAADEGAVSPLNFGTVAAFLAWFGGSGFLLTRHTACWAGLGLLLAGACGLVGATVVFVFLSKLVSPKDNLDPDDYRMIGVLGRVSSGIRDGGTGEIVYSQEGTRRTCGARSENGAGIEKGIEVVVTRYERGLAYVRRWDDLAGDGQPRG